MTNLAQQLQAACDVFELRIDLDHVVRMGTGDNLRAIARIRDLGAENGMLIFTDFEPIRAHVDRLVDAGYGFSVLSEPSRDDPDDLDACLDMFRDWGWSGPADRRPDWLSAPIVEGPSEATPDAE